MTKQIKKHVSILLSLIMILGMFTAIPLSSSAAIGDDLSEDDYLTFTAEEAGSTVTLKVRSGIDFQYDLNGTGLTDYTLGTTITLENEGDYVRFCGTDTIFNNTNHVSLTGKVACSGNVMSLRLNGGKVQGLATGCFLYMFANCQGLTAAPELPETTLANNCYSYMFRNCVSLTEAPELPATTLTSSCYSDMFSGCESLTELPALPATTLASSCYRNMFKGCSKICISEEAGTFGDITYSAEYRIPSEGTATNAANALNDMFADTGGKFKGTPSINTIYYVPAPPPPHTHDGVTYQPWTATDSLPTTAGNYYLANEVVLSTSSWTAPTDGDTRICLNGYGIRREGSGYMIQAHDGNSLTLTIDDCGTDVINKITLNNYRGAAVERVSVKGVDTINSSGTGDVYINGGYLTGAAGEWGSAIRVTRLVTINGGTIIGNTSTTSGAVRVNGSHQLTLNGGQIIYNLSVTDAYNGGAINEEGGGIIKFSGNPVVKNNFDTNGNARNVNLRNGMSNIPKVIAPLTEGAEIGITMQSGFGVFTASDDTSYNDAGKFTSDNDSYAVGKNAAGQLLLGAPCTVTWKNGDNVIETDENVAAGSAPSYDGETPVKPDDDTYTYTFAGWNDGTNTYALNEALPQVNGDITFTAVFTSAVKTYTVTWKNGDTVLETDTGVEAGSLPSFEGTMPTKADDDTYTYTFAGWNDGTTTYGLTDTLPAVTGDVTYTAVFTEEPIIKDPTVEADGLYIKVSNVGDFKYVLVISGEYDNYKDIKTNKDKADYYYGITAPKLDQAGGSYAFTIPAAGIYTVCVRRSDGTDLTYTVTVEAPAAPAHSFNVEVAGTVVTFTTDSEIKIVRFALGEGITNMTDMRAAAGVRGYLGMRFASGSFTMTVLPAGTYSYAVEYTDGIQEFGEFTVEENASKTPIITAEGVTGDWSLIARVKYAPGTIATSADFKTAAGLRVLYAPAEGSTATYRKGVLSGDWSFEVVYADGTTEIINKTF